MTQQVIKAKVAIADELEKRFPEVSPKDFYRGIFPRGSLALKGIKKTGTYSGIAIEVLAEKNAKGGNIVRRYNVTDELSAIDDMVSRDNFCLMSPISYAGKTRKSENARYLHAFAIDLDGIDTLDNLETLFWQIDNGERLRGFVWGLPRPTYIVASGTGVHIYYLFTEPIPLYPNIVDELVKLRQRLTWQAWTQGASTHKSIQYESLFQGFRVVGTITKTKKRVRAFLVGEKVDIPTLNFYVPEGYHAVIKEYQSTMSLADAKEKYPEWYQRRIIQKAPRNTWVCKKALYDWWIGKVHEGGWQGHRYWCIMTLATYAKKCGVDYDTLLADAMELRPILEERGDAFTVDDVMHALEAYNDSYITYPIDTIEARTNIRIDKNKRNFRKQAEHLHRARAVQAIDYPNGEWRNKDGRPKGSGTKKVIVQAWREKNPQGKKIDCHRDTGIDPKTIRKWWDA